MVTVLRSLGYADLRESLTGFVSIVRTVGVIDGCRAISFATRRHLADIWSGKGDYPEKGKRRIWFKLNYLKYFYDYFRAKNSMEAMEDFYTILRGPSIKFIANVIPPARQLTRDFTLYRLWPEMIEKDYNVVAEACPPGENFASIHVHRCFINEVVRDVGLMPVGDRICHADFMFWEKYHPNITFSRTKTLLAGDDLCDHTLNWKE